jgi:hypothetical protein
MTLRAALLALLVALATGAPAAAQSTNPTGSLTLISRPSGVSFRITGDHEVAGRTPTALAPWLPGTYRIRASGIGYERWSRRLVSNGMTSDTLWMALQRKNILGAAGRSLLVPGWGQLYDDHPRRGAIFLAVVAAAAAGAGAAHMRYRDRVDGAYAAQAAYLAAPTPEAGAAWQRAADEVSPAQRLRQGFIWSGLVLWGLSVTDAMAFVPRPSGPALMGSGLGASNTARGALRPDGPRLVVTFAQSAF